jgi:hypothetical protein
MAIPDTYLALLDILADAFERYEVATGHCPVLVGGGAVAVQTQGAFMSGDLDSLRQAMRRWRLPCCIRALSGKVASVG